MFIAYRITERRHSFFLDLVLMEEFFYFSLLDDWIQKRNWPVWHYTAAKSSGMPIQMIAKAMKGCTAYVSIDRYTGISCAHGCAGTSTEWRLMRENLSRCEFFLRVRVHRMLVPVHQWAYETGQLSKGSKEVERKWWLRGEWGRSVRGTDPGKYDGILREVSPVMSMHRIIRNRGLQ